VSKKFIPNGDFDFAVMAEHFARCIAKEPGRFSVAPIDVEALTTAVTAYRAALDAARGQARSTIATQTKDIARAAAEKIIRRIANTIRANDSIDPVARHMIGLRERPTTLKQQPCPQEPPTLRFVRALHEGGGATPMHELKFSSRGSSTLARPDGAVRLELFVDLVPPDETIPAHPGANHGGRPWYLRSYTRSPIVLAPPMTLVPMRVVYWGRWADSAGNVGPFSATAVGWIGGGVHAHLPGGVGAVAPGSAPRPALLPDQNGGGNPTISVLVLEAQYESFHPHALPQVSTPESHRLQGPGAEEAA